MKRKKSAGWYVDKINQIPLISREEERQLALIRSNNVKAWQKLIASHLRFVAQMASYFGKVPGLTKEDLIDEGSLGLIKAVRGFDLDRKCKVITYARSWIIHTIGKAISENEKFTKNNLSIEGNCDHGRKNENNDWQESAFVKLLECFPKTADRDIERLVYANLAHRVGMDDSDGNELSADRQLDGESFRIEIDQILNILTEREQKIIRLYFGLWDGRTHTFKEIGEIFGLTNERIRQIKVKALKKLKHPVQQRIIKSCF